jgi:predicted molibdopterin-dependent oxidoreductase YjgC
VSAAAGTVRFWLDGEPCSAPEGQSLVAALVRHGVWQMSRNPVTGGARGPHCGMGVCFECVVSVDGSHGVRSCMARVREGLQVRTAAGDGA